MLEESILAGCVIVLFSISPFAGHDLLFPPFADVVAHSLVFPVPSDSHEPGALLRQCRSIAVLPGRLGVERSPMPSRVRRRTRWLLRLGAGADACGRSGRCPGTRCCRWHEATTRKPLTSAVAFLGWALIVRWSQRSTRDLGKTKRSTTGRVPVVRSWRDARKSECEHVPAQSWASRSRRSISTQ